MCVCVCVCVCVRPRGLNSCSKVTRQSASVIKVGVVDVDVRISLSSHLKEELAWAIDKRLRVISNYNVI